MIYKGGDPSVPQRVTVQVAQTVLLAAGIWLAMSGGGDFTRRLILSVSFAVVYVRMSITLFVLLKRAMGWEEALTVPLAFALYYIGFALLGRGRVEPLGILAYAGVALFVAGSLVNTLSETLRYRWKADPANKGRLYTGGLFRFAVHINYFGDVLWVLGLACMTANPWSFIIPALLFCFFAFYNGPMLDRHLEERYGEDFRRYASRTARIIPFVY